jgi:hypothetical protein
VGAVPHKGERVVPDQSESSCRLHRHARRGVVADQISSDLVSGPTYVSVRTRPFTSESLDIVCFRMHTASGLMSYARSVNWSMLTPEPQPHMVIGLHAQMDTGDVSLGMPLYVLSSVRSRPYPI